MATSLQLTIVSVVIVLASFVIATVSPVTKSSAQYFSNDVTDQMKTDLGFQELAMAVPTLSGSSNTAGSGSTFFDFHFVTRFLRESIVAVAFGADIEMLKTETTRIFCTPQMTTDLGFQELATEVRTLSGSSNTGGSGSMFPALHSVTRFLRERIVALAFGADIETMTAVMSSIFCTDQMKTDLGLLKLAMAAPTLSGSSNTTWRLFSVTRLPIRERIVPGLFSHPYLEAAVAFSTDAPDKANERMKGATVEYETQDDNGEEKEGEDGNSSDHERSSDDDTNEEEGEGEGEEHDEGEDGEESSEEEHDEGEDGEESSEEEHDEREEEEEENDGENEEEMDEEISDDVYNWWMRHMNRILDERNDNVAHLYDTSGEKDNMADWWSELVGDSFLDRHDFLEGLWKEAKGEDVSLDRMFQILVEYYEEQAEVDPGLNAAAADEGEEVAVVEENKEEVEVDVNQEVAHRAELPIEKKKPEDDHDQEKALKTNVVHEQDK